MIATGLQTRVYEDRTRSVVLDDLTDRMTAGTLRTAVHGGYARAQFRVPMDEHELSLYFNRGNLAGYHFAHVEVMEGTEMVWEGRLMRPAFGPDGQGGLELRIEAAGYWSSLKDQVYTATVVSPDTQKDLIEDMLANKAPDISTDYDDIDDPGLDLGGLVLTREYPQDIIIDRVPNTTDGTDQWYAYIYGRGSDDKPRLSYKQRVSTTVHWTTNVTELAPNWEISQDAYVLRNNIIPVKDGVLGTAAADADKRSNVPTRDLVLDVAAGLDSTAENAERDRALAEKKAAQQTQAFTIEGSVWDTRVSGARTNRPLWYVRAGDVIRFEDLFPQSAVNPAFDSLRTFFIRETEYDMVRHVLNVTPDRTGFSLSRVLPRLGQVELAR